MPRYLASCHFHRPELGEVHLAVRQNSTRLTARWRDGVLHMSIPPRVTAEEFESMLEELKPRLLRKRPSQGVYYPGRLLQSDLLRVEIRLEHHLQRQVRGIRLVADGSGVPAFAVLVPQDADFADPTTIRSINAVLTRIAASVAPAMLPRARTLAEQLGCKPRSIGLSRGIRTLGRCSARGEIHLSAMLVFAPQELRDYVVCHELAHLTCMDHSPRFHALCNRYCGGREAELEAMLRRFRFPSQA